MLCYNNVQGFIQDFELGGGEQDGSRMIVCEMHPCLQRGLGAFPPQENFNFVYLSDHF